MKIFFETDFIMQLEMELNDLFTYAKEHLCKEHIGGGWILSDFSEREVEMLRKDRGRVVTASWRTIK